MKILIADSDASHLEELKTILLDYGKVEVTTGGVDAFTRYHNAILVGKPFNLIIIDKDIGGVPGLELLQRMVIEDSKWKFQPARKVMIANSGDPSTVIQAKKNKCDAFLVKPIRRSVLESKLTAIGITRQ